MVGPALLLLVACGAETASPEPTIAPSLDDLAGGEAGYEMVVDSLGADLRRRLVTPPVVGDSQRIEVRITTQMDEGAEGDAVDGGAVDGGGVEGGTAEGGTVEGGTVAAELQVVVEMAGTSQTLALVVDEVDASDSRLALLMARGKGSTATVQRDEAVAVTGTAVTITGSPDDVAAEWIERLLLTPAALMGPIPLEPLGEGARWTVTVQDADGDRTTRVHELMALTDDRYVIVIEGDDGAAVLEGQIGRAIPERQEAHRGVLTITSNVVHTTAE